MTTTDANRAAIDSLVAPTPFVGTIAVSYLRVSTKEVLINVWLGAVSGRDAWKGAPEGSLLLSCPGFGTCWPVLGRLPPGFSRFGVPRLGLASVGSQMRTRRGAGSGS